MTAAGALANLVAHPNSQKHDIVAAGGVQGLVRLLGSSNEGVQMTAASAIANMFGNPDFQQDGIVAAGGVRGLCDVGLSQFRGIALQIV